VKKYFRRLNLPWMRRRPSFARGTVVGRVKGPLASLDAFKETELIVPACHDTASAIAGIPTSLSSTAYISFGHMVAGGHADRSTRDDARCFRFRIHKSRRRRRAI